MRRTRRVLRALRIALAATVVGAGLSVAVTVGTAQADPTWEPDPNAASPYGNVQFYDATGAQIYGGSDLTHIADYALATTDGDPSVDGGAGAKATLYFANPTPGQATGNWPTGQASSSTAYPNASAPGALAGSTHPLVTIAASSGNLAGFISGHTVNTTTGYANVYQVRIQDIGPNGGSGSSYWETDIQVDPTAGTWWELYPVAAAPPGPAPSPSPTPTSSSSPTTTHITSTPAPTVSHSATAVATTTSPTSSTTTGGVTPSMTTSASPSSANPTTTGAAIAATSTGGAPLGSDPTLAPGQTVLISAGGFVPDEAVTVTLHSRPAALPATHADTAGRVSAYLFRVPSHLPAGQHRVVLSGATHTAAFGFRVVSASQPTSGQSSAAGANGKLAHTGADVARYVWLGLLTAAAGLGLMAAGRRRYDPRHAR